ncbi:MAG: APC family permease [Clostridia bacterium]|nr:APC family permease [Clostridia bacterium]
MKNQNNKTLRRQLSPMHVWALAFGCIIEWGSFVNPGKKFLPDSGVAGTAIAMALGAIVMIIIAFNYAYMIPKYPKVGGEFTFTKECLGKNIAFICGWFLIAAYLTNVPMNSTAIGLIVDGLDGNADILKFGFHYTVAGFEIYFGEMLVSTAILVLFAVVNWLGVKKAGIVQTVLSGLLVVSVFALAIAALISSKAQGIHMEPVWGFDKNAAMAAGATSENISDFAKSGTAGITSAILATFAITPWAYVGFDTIPQAAEEFKFSYKKVMGIMVLAILFGCFVYTTNNTVAAVALENWPDRVMAGDWVLLVAAEEMLGVFGKVLVGTAVSGAVLSGIMGFYLASSRLMYSIAQDAYLPEIFAKLDGKYGTPRNAIFFCFIISLSGPILGREALGWFVDMSAIGASMGFFFTCAAAFKKMRADQDGNAFLKSMSIMGMLFSALFMILQFIPIPGMNGLHWGKESYWMLLVWIIIGVVSFLTKKKVRN